MRPSSFQREMRTATPELQTHAGLVAAARRSSTHSQFNRPRLSPNPPLPHQPQAHFYGPPDLDSFDPQPRSGIKAGDRGYYFGFDSIPAPGSHDHGPGKDNVVIAGYEGGLEVYSVGQRGREHVASLKGLRGGVVHAKILPSVVPGVDDLPLVAVVIHGPAFPLPDESGDEDYDAVSADRSDAISNINQDVTLKDGGTSRQSPGYIDAYQTSVEIYSLKTNQRVEVLLEAPKLPLRTPITSPLFQPPPPSGAFNIRADLDSVVVSSGETGECWVYRQMTVRSQTSEEGVDLQFVCVGKIWTSLQHALKDESAEAQRPGGVPTQASQRPQSAILSLKSGWIAYCPAAPQSHLALRAFVGTPVYGKAPLLSSLAPPHLPPVNAEVDSPVPESVVNKIMRDATQGILEGSRLVAKHGLRAWQGWWDPQAAQAARSPPSTQGWLNGHAARQESPQFPPTHGASAAPTLPKEPGLVSILSVDSFGTSNSLHPTATFQVPHGCSFLSLSPSGQLLFTASSKGDVQTVWDLMRTENTKSSAQQPSAAKSAGNKRIRQVAQFSRMTVARIIDVAWTKPNGERAAIVTERGTVHLFELPASAFTWPPPRRRAKEANGQAPGAETGPSAVAMASSALNSVRDVARPLMSRPRRSASNVTPLTGSGLVSQAAHGGKAIAVGISHSLGRTVEQIRRTGDNRVSLPNSARFPEPSCVTWVTRRKGHHLYVLGDGLVRTFPTKSRKAKAGEGQRRVVRLAREKDYTFPRLPDDQVSLLVRAYLDPEDYPGVAEALAAGNHQSVLDNRMNVQELFNYDAGSAIPQAEIESSAPYQPFHTDRRVVLYEYDADDSVAGQAFDNLANLLATATLDGDPATGKACKRKRQERQQRQPESPAVSEAWVFGQPVNATKLDLGTHLMDEEESFSIASGDIRALPASAIETVYHHVGANDDQIVVTTRRRKGAGRATDHDDDGFFEDDCEVLDFADQRV